MSIESYILRIQKEKNPDALDKAVLSFLGGLSSLYERGVVQRREKELASAVTVDVPVISVGNLTAGGTGKTPCIMALAEWLLKKGRKPAVLTRGYRGGLEKTGGPVSDFDGILVPQSMAGDEPYMMAARLRGVPVLAGRDRVASAEQAISMGADVLLMDDGFQYWKLRRDLDIILIDCTFPFGGDHVLPRGLLREPLEAASRASLFILTKSDQVSEEEKDNIRKRLTELNPEAPVIESLHQPSAIVSQKEWNDGIHEGDFASMKNHRVYLVCGIGNPEAFRRTASDAGLHVAGMTSFPDHHAYTPDDLGRAAERARKLGADILVTTEKDIVKIHHVPSMPLYVLEIHMQFPGDGDGALKRSVEKIL
jgi:tetraacyldisaccharide 4'-kinase